MTRQFLQQLPPLSSLQVTEWHRLVTVESIAETHGSHLRTLALEYNRWQYVTESAIRELARKCPLLEDLTIPIRRTEGDANEVAIYRALGSIRKLKNLHLSMDPVPVELFSPAKVLAPVPQPDEVPHVVPAHPSFDEFENEPCSKYLGISPGARYGHLRQILVSSVIDKNLACAIFHTIDAAKPDRTSPLQHLGIKVLSSKRWRSTTSFLVRVCTTWWTIDREPGSGALIATPDVERTLSELFVISGRGKGVLEKA
ncbi:hypothetical protein N7512_000827 [Penicillium capsulatum]|nr:hypothetical protein N7512_000827 [Penicillium capsulatum]